MTAITKKLNPGRNLPLLGVLAFSLASCWTLFNLFNSQARHPSELYWGPAILVELTTAYLIYKAVDMLHRVTRTNTARQDRRFYTIVLAAFLLLAIPTLGATLWANYWQFNNWLLAALFPGASVVCAIAASLPDSITRYENTKAREKEEARKTREANRRAKEVARKEQEKIRMQQEAQQDAIRKQQEVDRKKQEEKQAQLARLGAAGRVLEVYQANPHATQQEVANSLGITDRAVRYHLGTLEDAGLIEKNGKGMKVVG